MAETRPSKVDVITTGYVYDRPGRPPIAIGTKLSLHPAEAERLRQHHLVRFTDEASAYEVSGPKPDRTVKTAPPPPAPPLSTAKLPEQVKP